MWCINDIAVSNRNVSNDSKLMIFPLELVIDDDFRILIAWNRDCNQWIINSLSHTSKQNVMIYRPPYCRSSKWRQHESEGPSGMCTLKMDLWWSSIRMHRKSSRHHKRMPFYYHWIRYAIVKNTLLSHPNIGTVLPCVNQE